MNANPKPPTTGFSTIRVIKRTCTLSMTDGLHVSRTAGQRWNILPHLSTCASKFGLWKVNRILTNQSTLAPNTSDRWRALASMVVRSTARSSVGSPQGSGQAKYPIAKAKHNISCQILHMCPLPSISLVHQKPSRSLVKETAAKVHQQAPTKKSPSQPVLKHCLVSGRRIASAECLPVTCCLLRSRVQSR